MCGSGKTIMANYISCKVGLKTIIIVHTSILLDQWIERISQFVDGAKIGIIQQNKFDIIGKTHVIASMQTLVSRASTYDSSLFDCFGLLIVDEAHTTGAEMLSKAIGIIGCKYRLGLSATPFRKDKFDKVNFYSIGEIGASIKRDSESQELNVECIHLDFPVKIHYITRAGGRKLPNLAKMVNEICENDDRNDCIVSSILKNVKENRHIIVTSSRRNHLKVLADKLTGSGFHDFGYLIGGLKKDPTVEKKQVLLCTYSFVAEGLDIPSLDSLIMVCPKVDVIQTCGRILRKHPGKKVPVIIDFVDTQGNVFKNQSTKRIKYYKTLGANILIFDQSFNLIQKGTKRKPIIIEEESVDSRKRMCDIFKSKI